MELGPAKQAGDAPKIEAARLIIPLENPLTLEHLSRTAYGVATSWKKHPACQAVRDLWKFSACRRFRRIRRNIPIPSFPWYSDGCSLAIQNPNVTMIQIRIQHAGTQHGPYSLEVVRSFLKNGTYQSSDLAWIVPHSSYWIHGATDIK